jgi:hypothetical protein
MGGVGLRGGTTFNLMGREPPGESQETFEGLVNQDVFTPDSQTTRVSFDRRKAYGAVGVLVFAVPMPDEGRRWYDVAPYYFTQVELVVGMGLSVRLGVNPGELLDFALGCLGADIYGDDIERRREFGRSMGHASTAPDRPNPVDEGRHGASGCCKPRGR